MALRNLVKHLPFLLVIALTLSQAAAETAITDSSGMVTALSLGGEYLPIQTDLRLPRRGWGQIPGLTSTQEVKQSVENGQRAWTGSIVAPGGERYRYTETLSEADGAITLDLRVTSESDTDMEGVFFWLDFPIAPFAGGVCSLGTAGAPAVRATLPVDKPENRHFLNGKTDQVTVRDRANNLGLELRFDRALPVVVQDSREWKGTDYSAFFQLAPSLRKGESTALRLTIKPSGEPDRTPAKLTLRPDQVRFHLDGFGGDYCFNIESPVTQYTLKNLNVAWARTELTANEWEPENDNADANVTNWQYLESQDRPDSNLRREFLLAKQIQDKGIPYVISIWRLPEWLYADPGKNKNGGRRIVPPEKWPEMLECVGSYLLYAKRQYGVEPNLFSFNESDYGVQVFFTPEGHRELIKVMGAYLQRLGLKTKMLLGDTTGPRGTHAFAQPAAQDPEALRYAGAVAFHSWGGASPEEYGAWSDLARRAKLPLLVTELGVDAGAWRSRAFDFYHYALREAQMYQEVLLYARPQGTMQWEFTADYSIVREKKGADGAPQIQPTERYAVVKQFCNLTPRNADALETASDNAKVLFTAFAGQQGKRRVYTLHLVNTGAAREATITGIPAALKSLRAIQTTEGHGFEELPAVPVRGGTVKLNLETASLLTLTSME